MINELIKVVELKTRYRVAFETIGYDVMLKDDQSLLDKIHELEKLIEQSKKKIKDS